MWQTASSQATDLSAISMAAPLPDLLAIVMGACIGSFLNVVVWRLPRGESLSHPGSHCPICNHPLRAWENIPVLAWLLLRARCSSCKSAISPRYPLVESFTALIFLLLWRRALVGAIPLTALPAALFLAGLVIAAGLIDAEHRIIPNHLTATGLGFALLAALLWPPASHLAIASTDYLGPAGLTGIGNQWIAEWWPRPAISDRLIALNELLFGVVGTGLFLWLIRQLVAAAKNLTDKRWPINHPVLGMGDIKLLAVIGGLVGLEAALMIILYSSLAGTITGLAWLALTGMRRGWSLPYGLFVGLATLAWLLGGEVMVELLEKTTTFSP